MDWRALMKLKDRRARACQHCYRAVRPSEDAPDRAVDDRGELECLPGLLHKIMPEASKDCFDGACGYEEPHRHGFACDKSCEVCGGR